MKHGWKVLLIMTLIAGAERPALGADNARILTACHNYFILLSRARFGQAAKLAEGDLRTHLQAWSRLQGSRKHSLQERYQGSRFLLTKIQAEQDQASLFVLHKTAHGKHYLYRYYFRISGGHWRPYRRQALPFLNSIP